MKPFLGIDVTENDESTVISGEEFIISRAATAEEPVAEAEADTEEEELVESEEVEVTNTEEEAEVLLNDLTTETQVDIHLKFTPDEYQRIIRIAQSGMQSFD